MKVIFGFACVALAGKKEEPLNEYPGGHWVGG